MKQTWFAVVRGAIVAFLGVAFACLAAAPGYASNTAGGPAGAAAGAGASAPAGAGASAPAGAGAGKPVASAATDPGGGILPQVVGGMRAAQGEFPWMAPSLRAAGPHPRIAGQTVIAPGPPDSTFSPRGL